MSDAPWVFITLELNEERAVEVILLSVLLEIAAKVSSLETISPLYLLCISVILVYLMFTSACKVTKFFIIRKIKQQKFTPVCTAMHTGVNYIQY